MKYNVAKHFPYQNFSLKAALKEYFREVNIFFLYIRGLFSTSASTLIRKDKALRAISYIWLFEKHPDLWEEYK